LPLGGYREIINEKQRRNAIPPSSRRPLMESFRNPIFWGAVAASLAVTIWLCATRGFSPSGSFRIYTAARPLPSDYYPEEIAEAALYLVIFLSALCLAVAVDRRRYFYLLYGLFFLLFAMEETDWLQQYLHYPSPSYFLAHNAQGVVNLHNLTDPFGTGAGLSLTLLVRLVLGLPILGFVAYSAWRAWRGDFRGKLVPLWILVTAVLDWFPLDSIFQLIFAIGALAYLWITFGVDQERHRRFLTPADPDETAG